jgi:hypothetical protein
MVSLMALIPASIFEDGKSKSVGYDVGGVVKVV